MNAQFARSDQLYFVAGAGQRPVAHLRHQGAETAVSLYGGHVLSYQPAGQAPMLWLSQLARYQDGSAIRGGIPLIWPWFGAHPSDAQQPSHGFARVSQWQVRQTAVTAHGPQLRLGLGSSEATLAFWPHLFELELCVTLGESLQVSLKTKNVDERPFTIRQALHTYFSIQDIVQVKIQGLDGCTYIDQLAENGRFTQHGPVTFAQETDRIYLNTPETLWLDDLGGQRRIQIRASGGRSAVVWNPWVDKARRMSDFGGAEYRQMVCVETANVADDQRVLLPGKEHDLTAVIQCQPLLQK